MAYAETTSVSVERTRAEIETLLSKRGASRFGYMSDEKKTSIMFVLRDRAVRFELPLPAKDEKRFTFRTVRGYAKPNAAEIIYKLWEQACRSRWRALFLCIKAKLEAVDVGITTFEAEFLAHVVMSDGRTIGQAMLPRLDDVTKGAPLLLEN